MKKYWIGLMVLITGGLVVKASISQQVPDEPDVIIVAPPDDGTMDGPDANVELATMPSPATTPTAPTASLPVAVTPVPQPSMTGPGNNSRRTGRTRNTRTGRPAGLAVSAAPVLAPPAEMPGDFDVLSQRNIFIKGSQETHPIIPATVPSGPIIVPETDLIFNGVTITAADSVAFLENARTNEVLIKRIGDPISSGKISNITMDYLEYEAAGKVYRVQIGQNLFGGVSMGATTQSTADLNATLQRMKAAREEEAKTIH